jgi:outer membrane protein OmpA-like peptidoglycan-associated protein
MKPRVPTLYLAFPLASLLVAQQPPAHSSVPLYRVTVVERTAKAVNYQYRAEPTEIDFRGTVLLPEARGHAWVQSKQGRTEIDANMDHMQPSQRFGREYLTYVLWAITPEGRPHNLGEVVLNGSDKSHLRVTTDLQAFALIVTAEPYGAVRTPSDVVVLENEIRPDTVGRIETVDAKYELLPRGEYTWQISDKLNAELANTPRVSSGEYDALLELYQAQNAVGIAGSAGAGQYAPNTYAKAQQLLTEAQSWQAKRGESRKVVEYAKEAAQTAEDARVIAQQRQQEQKLQAATAEAAAAHARAQAEIASAQQAAQQAALAAQQAQADAASAQQRAEAERLARERAEADAAAARQQAAQQQTAQQQAAIAPPLPPVAPSVLQPNPLRARVFEELNGVMLTRDTPRGLVVTIPGSDFNGESLRSAAALAQIAAIIARHPGLEVSCEGHLSADHSEAYSRERAEAVRNALVSDGLPAGSITVVGYGNTRPLGPNTTAEGREENSRVEIVISGNAIGTVPFWDKTYPLTRG